MAKKHLFTKIVYPLPLDFADKSENFPPPVYSEPPPPLIKHCTVYITQGFEGHKGTIFKRLDMYKWVGELSVFSLRVAMKKVKSIPPPSIFSIRK